jgi:putative Holliday junction resolvase
LEVVPADRLVEYLRALFEEENVAEVVAGVPRTLKGEVGFQAKRALTKLDALKKTFPRVDFVEWDERLTTRQIISSRRRDWTGQRKGRVRERVDHLAAASMLQEYLDRKETVEAVRRRLPQA